MAMIIIIPQLVHNMQLLTALSTWNQFINTSNLQKNMKAHDKYKFDFKYLGYKQWNKLTNNKQKICKNYICSTQPLTGFTKQWTLKLILLIPALK